MLVLINCVKGLILLKLFLVREEVVKFLVIERFEELGVRVEFDCCCFVCWCIFMKLFWGFVVV